MSVYKHETQTFNIKYTWFSSPNKLGPPTELKKK